MTLMTTTASRELHHFLLLTHEQQVEAIRRMHAMGMSDHTIAAATRLSVEMIRRLLAEVMAENAGRRCGPCDDFVTGCPRKIG